MGFWHTGYMEFHEPTEENTEVLVQGPVKVVCTICGLEFNTERDLRVHTFEGHPIQRPVLALKGREFGTGRITVTSRTSAADWMIQCADRVTLNGNPTTAFGAIETLSSQRSGVVEVRLGNTDVVQTFQIEFLLAEEDDLIGVDAALDRLIDSGELSPRSIDDFIMRTKPFATAARYTSGLADYLYGAHLREGGAGSGSYQTSRGGGYQGKYDQAVGILGSFDRAPAEAICGIVAFHYNQFQRAMTKTKSQRVAEVSLRFKTILGGGSWFSGDLSQSQRSSLDVALSDSVIEQVLGWSALPLDGTAVNEVAELVTSIDSQRSSDAFKLRLVAAEHTLAVGDYVLAKQHAEHLRHKRLTESWYAGFQTRAQQLQGVLDQ